MQNDDKRFKTMICDLKVVSLICVYGPKVTMALALNSMATKTGQAVCVELTMGPDRCVLYCTVLYCTVLYCNVLYCTVLY